MMPPNTEAIAVNKANFTALCGFDMDIGISMTSGGMGKKIASIKLTNDNQNGAKRCFDQAMVLSYIAPNKFIYFPYVERRNYSLSNQCCKAFIEWCAVMST